jgi:pyrroloquinoline-quinone synthase
MTEQDFLHELDAILEAGHLLKHPFYQSWSAGALSLDTLREYAEEYYLLVHAFPTFVSATHAACEDIDVRRMLLENLLEEEGGEVHHPELWLRFADALGAERQPLSARERLPQTIEAVRRFRALSRSEVPTVGLAALYAYEAQIPSVATAKIDGLQRFYGITSDEALSFFRVHEKADRVHSAVTRAALRKLCDTPETRGQALEAAREAVSALNLLLDGVLETCCRPAAA